MEFKHQEVESKWKNFWTENEIYKVKEDPDKPKYYVLDMFPYPSGAGLHVGHPLGYIASDIIARTKNMKGFSVLHPMGFDAFGLPAEQYAIQTGQHPSISTHANIETYKSQLDNIGFNYDWSREVRTCTPDYYRWTQWIFLKLFEHYYCLQSEKAKPITDLVSLFEKQGSQNTGAFCGEKYSFSAADWIKFSDKEKQEILMSYRLAFRKKGFVNWCEALGTVLANDEVKDGVSERGGHPVEKKPMMQWALRITAYAERLLDSLNDLEWSDSLKIMQQNWIGKSKGAHVEFKIENADENIEIYTTRPDTIFGATFIVLAPEHPLVDKIVTIDQSNLVSDYILYTKKRTERERQSEAKQVTGVFTGSYAVHPFTHKKIPIWIAEYVLIDYGTGAIMAVPSNDQRDKVFAEKFELAIIPVIDQSQFPHSSIEEKVGTMINSEFLNGLEVAQAIEKILGEIEKQKLGKAEVQFKMRDANFSRQRYWGEPFPIIYSSDDIPVSLTEKDLPVLTPWIDIIQAGSQGQSPLIHATEWVHEIADFTRETDTMPGYAGSSWYFLRYMDPKNEHVFASEEKLNYWKEVDLYIGGTEHAVGHLMYSRFWHKFLFDLGYVHTQEPFKKLVNQGMIQGEINRLFLRKKQTEFDSTEYADANYVKDFNIEEFVPVEVPLKFVKKDVNGKSFLDKAGIDEFLAFHGNDLRVLVHKKEAEEKWMLDSEIGKMSKRYHNVVNPDEVVAEYGADCFRMYEMFLGPLEQSKPWDTKGISGVAGFLRRYFSLFWNANDEFYLTDEEPSREELKVLHTCIKKVNQDTESLSFNTSVSAFMICVNSLKSMACTKRQILIPLTQLLAPFAPFITEEVWHLAGNSGSIQHSKYPEANEDFLVEDSVNYPVSVNGKKRYEWKVSKAKPKSELESEVLELDEIKKWIDGVQIKKIIIVPERMINIVL